MTRLSIVAGCFMLLACQDYDVAKLGSIPADVQASVRSAVDNKHRPGVVVGLVNPYGTYFYSYGVARAATDAAISEQSQFAIGSLTKLFTAELLATLEHKQVINQDQLLSEIWPEVEDNAGTRLHHLASHFASLPRDLDQATLAENSSTLLLGALSRKAALPADYAYSSVGMAILGLSLAKIANAELGLLLQQEVLTPLGLTNTGYQANAEILSTRHHITTPIGSPAKTPDVAYGAGGLYSTATDLMHFLKNQLRQKRTLGWKQYQDEQFTAYYHGGDGNGHQAFMAFRPDNGVGVILLSNSSADDALQDIALHLIDPDRDLPAFEHSPYRRLGAAQLLTFAGRYAIVADPSGNTIELQPEDGRLMYHEKTPSGKTVRRSALYAVNEHTFELIGLPVQLVFKPDDAQAHAVMLFGEQQYRLTKLN